MRHSDAYTDDVSNVEAAFASLYTALTVLLVVPDDAGARTAAADALRETRPLLLGIMHKAGM